MRRLEDKVAIITGSSRGLGFACADSLGMEGAQVVLCGRNEDQLNASLSNLHNKDVRFLKFIDHPITTRLVTLFLQQGSSLKAN